MRLADRFEILSVPPAQCASLFKEGRVDISLCPVGALEDLPPFEVRGRYCIGADGPVATVMLLSKVPLEQITSVRLDQHSRTSNLLIQMLASKYWKKDWEFYASSDQTLPEACLMIGDKVFANASHFPYQYDLAKAWKELTGKPMVFAVWITRPDVPAEVVAALDEAFEAGMAWIKSGQSELADWQIAYLLQNISYPLDVPKQEAMQLFLDWAGEFSAEPLTHIPEKT